MPKHIYTKKIQKTFIFLIFFVLLHYCFPLLLCFHPATLLPVQFILTEAFIQLDVSSTVSMEEEQLISGLHTGQDKHSLLEVHGDLIGDWHHLQSIISLVWHTGRIFLGFLAFWKPMKVRQINLHCDWFVSPHAVQRSEEGERCVHLSLLFSLRGSFWFYWVEHFSAIVQSDCFVMFCYI